jgi:CheY-like chemotaxis protein
VTTPARILVVDDDTAMRQTIVELLQEEGYTVTSASNGAEALARLEEGAEPSLILLDLTMPIMDGWSFREAQQSDPRLARIPTVVVSASHSADAKTLERLSADAFLAKPFNLDRLIDTVERLC